MNIYQAIADTENMLGEMSKRKMRVICAGMLPSGKMTTDTPADRKKRWTWWRVRDRLKKLKRKALWRDLAVAETPVHARLKVICFLDQHDLWNTDYRVCYVSDVEAEILWGRLGEARACFSVRYWTGSETANWSLMVQPEDCSYTRASGTGDVMLMPDIRKFIYSQFSRKASE